MRKLVIAPVVAAAIATSGIAFGAATASAAPTASCPAATVSVSPGHTVVAGAGTTVTITGKNFGCHTTASLVYVALVDPQASPGNGPMAKLDKNGGFVSSQLVDAPAGHKFNLSITSGTKTLYSQGDFITVVAPTSSFPAPTAVPAGHVDVARNGSGSSDEGVALVAAAGVVMIGAGLAGARRRTSRRVNG